MSATIFSQFNLFFELHWKSRHRGKRSVLKTDTKILGNALIARLVGDIGEGVDFKPLIADGPTEIHIYCREVARINSIGIKEWIRFFSERTEKGVKLKFFECPPALVEQINLVVNFICDGIVESMYLPYCCPACYKSTETLVTIESLRLILTNLPEPQCPDCKKANLAFDDIPSEYFAFLSRK